MFVVGIITMIQGCGNNDIDWRIFGAAESYRPKPNEITKEAFLGEYYCVFPLGEFVLEFKPFDASFKPVEHSDGIYQQRIYWKSGRVYKSDWQLFYLGLDYKEPYVSLASLKRRLSRQEINDKLSGYIYTGDDLLKREPSDAEISAYPVSHYHAGLGFNYYHEIVIGIGADPEIWYAKRSNKYPNVGNTSSDSKK